MKRAQRVAHLVAPAGLLVAALLLSAGLPGAAPVAPKTLELGKGPTIVFFHGLGGSRLSWMPTAKKLLGGHRVVLVDLPGHGDTALPDPFSVEAVAEALDQVLAKQNPDSTVIVGQGIGGMLAVLDLKVHPERARGIVLIDVGLKSPITIEDPQQIKMFERFLDERYDDFMKMAYGRAGRDSTEGLRIRALAMQTPPATMKAYFRATFTANASPAFKSLKVPVLYLGTDRLFRERVQGTLDSRPGYADSVAARAHAGPVKDKDWVTLGKSLGFEDPAAVPLRRLSNTGALLMQDQPDSLAAVISEFTAQALAAKKK